MNSHPDVFMLKNEQFDIAQEVWKHRERWPELVGNVFNPLGSSGAHGCLVKASSVVDHLWRPLREEIAAVPGMHIILNSRRDYLSQYMSLAVAKISGQYSSELDPVDVAPFKINIGAMLKVFSNWDRKTDQFNEICAGLPCYHFYYEDMNDNVDEVVSNIYQFLGVGNSHKPTFTTKRQRRRMPEEMIVNFGMVVDAIKSSRWTDRLPSRLMLV
jgi:hypothetical protein